MTFYKVSFQYSATTYCTNIAKAESLTDVEKHYAKYEWYNISEADESDIREAERKGMPIIEIAHEEEPKPSTNTTAGKEQKKMNKFNIEKALHEIIRDLPDAANAERYFTKGYITIEEALKMITEAVTEEKKEAAKRRVNA